MKDVVRGWIERNAEAQLRSNVHTLALAVHRLEEKGKRLSARGTPGELLAQESSGRTQNQACDKCYKRTGKATGDKISIMSLSYC